MVFVCQAGELEIKALLLASSLRRYLRIEHELIAAVPTPASDWGEVAAETLATLSRLDVRVESIVNPIGPDYGIGNKLACLELIGSERRAAFLDSDILLLREWRDDPSASVGFAAKPADFRTYSSRDEDWRDLYARVGTVLPTMRFPTTISGAFGPPYFNSGVIFVNSRKNFGAAWTHCARRLLSDPAMQEHRHWLDQVSLAITVHELGLDYAALDERFNFPAHVKTLPDELPYLCHYHWPAVIGREPVLADLVRDLSGEHPGIARLMRSHPHWAGLSKPDRTTVVSGWRGAKRRTRRRVKPIVLIAGIPGSGGAELLRMLAEHADSITLDEPVQVNALMHNPYPPWELTSYLRQACQTAGTAPGARILAVKSELGFLCRLNALKRLCPDAHLVACVRDPFCTIATWKASRDDAAIEAAMVAMLNAVWLSRHDADQLRQIASMAEPAEKRAAYWWWLAQRLLDNAQGVKIVRHDALAQFPGKQLASILGEARLSGLTMKRSDQAEQDAAATLDDRDRQAIRAICLQAALELGLP